jgi:hypothetical protein
MGTDNAIIRLREPLLRVTRTSPDKVFRIAAAIRDANQEVLAAMRRCSHGEHYGLATRAE